MLSIITPIYNEENFIMSFLDNLILRVQDISLITEIILVNGESTDLSVKRIEQRLQSYTGSLHITLLNAKKGRAKQQNLGATHATGEVLFFLHADCLPEQGFETKIAKTYHEGNSGGVCHFIRTPQKRRTQVIDFLYNHSRSYRCRFGDSGIIISKELFWEIGGFDETMIIEEDHLLIMKLRYKKKFALFPIKIFVSDRLFRKNGFVKTLGIYTLIHGLFLCGVRQHTLLTLLRHIKGQKNLSSSIMQNHEYETQ